MCNTKVVVYFFFHSTDRVKSNDLSIVVLDAIADKT